MSEARMPQAQPSAARPPGAAGALAGWHGEEPLEGVATLADRLARGELTSRDLVEAALGRIEATRSTVNAFRWVRAREALEEATAADAALA
ncbi:amidase, partial [Frankia sp. AgKG'84/4]|nr:amidase [Frankia sp. AgKG'84/4]